MFEEILRILRKRRVDDELKVMKSRIESVEDGELTAKLEDDPAKIDPDLNAKLAASYEQGIANEQKVGRSSSGNFLRLVVFSDEI